MNYALNTFTCRQVGVTGSVVYFIGSFLTAFATNVYQIIFTYGILQGIGLGLMVPAAFTSFNYYFVRRRTFAMAVTQMIIGVAAMVVPLMIQMLLEEYGFRGTQAIIAAFSLHAMLGMVVQQNVKYHAKRRRVPISLSSDVERRPSTDLIVHGGKAWHSETEKGSEVNIKIHQQLSEEGKDSEVNIKIHQHHSEVKAATQIRATSQELINIEFQNKNMCLDSSDRRISVGVVNELKGGGKGKETDVDKQVDQNEVEEKAHEPNPNSESNMSDEHKFLVQSGHSRKYRQVEQMTAEIGITVKRSDPPVVKRLPKCSPQVSNPVTDERKEDYRVRYDSTRDAASLESYESQDG